VANGEGTVLRAEGYQSVSSLQVVVRHGLTAIVQELITRSPETISKQNSHGMSALHEAAQVG